MRPETQNKLISGFQSDIAKVYKQAREYQVTQSRVHELLRPIWDKVNASGLPQYQRSGLFQYKQALHDHYYGNKYSAYEFSRMNLEGNIFWKDTLNVWN